LPELGREMERVLEMEWPELGREMEFVLSG
jgi:hypothetical protein